MAVEFPRGRLFVGFRAMNWAKIYYVPGRRDNGNDEDDENHNTPPDMYVFQSPKAQHGDKNPHPGEVNWLPHFDPKKFEADNLAGKYHMHRWFLYRCYEYLNAKSDAEVQKTLNENQFANANYPRWDTWMKEGARWRRKNRRGEIGKFCV